MILNRLKILIAEKEMREKRKLPYRTIAKETGVSTRAITAYAQQKVFRFDAQIIEAFCKYFSCQPGDLLIWDKNDPWVSIDIDRDPDPKKEKWFRENYPGNL